MLDTEKQGVGRKPKYVKADRAAALVAVQKAPAAPPENPAPATAKLNDIDPQSWLADVLAHIADTPQSRLAELLPWNWYRVQMKAAA